MNVSPAKPPNAVQRFLARRLRAWAPHTREDRNILFVTLDGAALGFTAASGAFLSVFVVRLGADAFWVSLLTAIPALVLLLLALPMSRIVESRRRLVPLFARTRILVDSGFLVSGLVPFFLMGERAAKLIVLLWGASAIATSISNLAFTLVMNRAVSRERRAVQMSSRWMAMGVSKIIIMTLAGQILDRVAFPYNYQIVFIGSFFFDLLAYYFINRVQIPDQEPAATLAAAAEPLLARMRATVREVWEVKPFVRFSLSRNVFWLGIEIMAPLIPIFWVKNLAASDAWVSYFNTTTSAAMLIAYYFWVRVKRRWGNRSVLLAAVFGRCLYPFLIALIPSPVWMLPVAALNGVAFAGENLMFFDAFLDTVPKGREPRFVALNQTISNTIAFIAPPFGAFLLPYLGIRQVFFLGAAVALCGFMLFVINGVAKEESRR